MITNRDSSFVAEEIDRLLTDRESELTDLTIVNSPQELVPSSICRLMRLNQLKLSASRLFSLPLECFSHMTNLVNLDVSSNIIAELQVMLILITFVG